MCFGSFLYLGLAGVVGILGLLFCMHVYICQRDSSLVGNACVLCILMLERLLAICQGDCSLSDAVCADAEILQLICQGNCSASARVVVACPSA